MELHFGVHMIQVPQRPLRAPAVPVVRVRTEGRQARNFQPLFLILDTLPHTPIWVYGAHQTRLFGAQSMGRRLLSWARTLPVLF